MVTWLDIMVVYAELVHEEDEKGEMVIKGVH